MKKRIISMMLAGLMTIGMLAGCGNDSGSESSGSSVSDAGDSREESASPEESGSQDSQSEASQEPEAADDGETVTVTWCLPLTIDKPADFDVVMEDLNKKIRDKINVELNLEIITQGEFNDKMKLKSTAQEDYDLVFTSNWLNSFDENMSRDAFLPVTDLVNQYGQDILETIPDWLMDVAKVDGELYAVPNQQITARQIGVVVLKEYADKYNLDLDSMTSVRDLEAFMDEIVANEPAMFAVDMRVDAILEEKYENLVSGYIFADKETGEVYTLAEVMDEQKKADNEWYQKGYIRQDIATVTDNSADVKANRYVISCSSYKPGWDAEYTQRQGADYISIPVEGAFVGATSGIETMTAVNVNSKHPAEAIKLLNLVYSDKEIYNELLYGLEGVHYTKVSEGHVEVLSDTKYTLNGNGWRFGNQFNAWYTPGQEDGLWEATDQLNKEAQVSTLRGFTFDQSGVQAELAQLSAVFAEYKNGQYTTNDIDGWLAEYKDKLEKAGINTVKEEVQRQIEAWKASR